MSDAPLVELEARHLTRHFKVRVPGHAFAKRRVVRAVDDVTLQLRAGEVTAVVGESGSGKSVLARLLARILAPTSGEVILGGTVISPKERRTLAYTSAVQLVLQDPFGSMNPVHQISHNMVRPLRIHGASKDEVKSLAEAALVRVSLEPPERFMDRFPHELSGGQLQRVALVAAFAARTAALVLDEPTAELDPENRDRVFGLLDEALAGGRCAVVVSEEEGVLARAGSRLRLEAP